MPSIPRRAARPPTSRLAATAAALAVLAAAWTTAAQGGAPDLVVDDIAHGALVPGKEASVTIKVRNAGTAQATNVSVSLFFAGPGEGDAFGQATVKNPAKVAKMAAKSTRSFVAKWTPPALQSYTLLVLVSADHNAGSPLEVQRVVAFGPLGPMQVAAGAVTSQLRTADGNHLAGHDDNAILAGVTGGTVGGGGSAADPNLVTDDGGTVGGGRNNQAGNDAGTTGDAVSATVAGGANNVASGPLSAIGGGAVNVASALRSTVSGGAVNTASGAYAAVPGGHLNVAGGAYSFAAGRRAQAAHDGAFVWADATNADVASPGANTFSVRAAGGIWLGTTSSAVIAAGRFLDTSTGAYLTTGGTWTDASSRDWKENLRPVDPRGVLDSVLGLPIAEWNYKVEPDHVRHLGPMAQDFHAAFGLGHDAEHIAALDTGGVALAAIQGLHGLVEAQERSIAALELANADLAARLAGAEARLAALEAA